MLISYLLCISLANLLQSFSSVEPNIILIWAKNNPRPTLKSAIIRPGLVRRKAQLIRGKTRN